MNYHQENHENDTASLIDRLNMIPIYAMALSGLHNAYSSLKERNDVLKGTFEWGEHYMQTATNAAKPVLRAATKSAFKISEPVLGPVADPVVAIDSIASETLAKVQEKFPLINETPSKIVFSLQQTAQVTASLYMQTMQDRANACVKTLQRTAPAKLVTTRMEDGVSLSEMLVEMFFPTYNKIARSDRTDMMEMEEIEREENDGVPECAAKQKDCTERRRRKNFETYKGPVQITRHAVELAQDKICQISHCLQQSYLMLSQRVYATSMYLPTMAVEVSSDVFVSTKEMLFAYHKAHSIRECPHAIVAMSEKCYKRLKTNKPMVASIEEKAVTFILIPAQVLSQYIANNPAIQWILPNGLLAQGADNTGNTEVFVEEVDEDPTDDIAGELENTDTEERQVSVVEEGEMLPLSEYDVNLF